MAFLREWRKADDSSRYRLGSSVWFFSLSEFSAVRVQRHKHMQIAGWQRVPELRVQDYTLWDEIPGRKKRRSGNGEIVDSDGAGVQPILITRHVYRLCGSWMLPREPPNLFSHRPLHDSVLCVSLSRLCGKQTNGILIEVLVFLPGSF